MTREQKEVGEYLNKRSEFGKIHRNDRESNAKLMADATLRGKLGCQRANEAIKAIDNLRARGF